MKHDGVGWTEADVVINGTLLSFQQAMTLRVAVSSMRVSLQDRDYANGVGLELARNYDAHLQAIEALMVQNQPQR